MQAYETGLGHNDTRMVLKPDSEFFRYFVDPSGRMPNVTPPQPAPGTPGSPTAAAR
jgi:membrane protease subunit HflC